MIDVKNPATGEIIESVSVNSKQEILEKIEIGHLAFKKWSNLDNYKRAKFLMDWSNEIDNNKLELSKIMTLESGKPISQSLDEIEYARSYIDWYAEEAKRIYGRTIPTNNNTKKIIIEKQPVGLVAGISPWNFPAAMIARKVAPALAAGCTFITKPAAETPLTTIKLIEYAHNVGIPKDVLQYVNGSGSDIGNIFTQHKHIKKITFTGSTEVGKILFRDSAETLKHLSMELGGHAPIIIHKDADVDDAVKQTIQGKFRNSGQTCISINRILVHENIEKKYTEKLKSVVKDLKIGNGLEKDTDIGPIINKKSFLKINNQIEDAISKGAEVVTGNKHFYDNNKEFYFIQPTILKNVNEDMTIMSEETFGPVLPIVKYNDLDEAIQIANSTPYGLAAYFSTNDMSTGLYIYNNLDFGVISWNDGAPSAANAPFGGMKESGLGREGGIEGIELYLDTKYLSIGGLL